MHSDWLRIVMLLKPITNKHWKQYDQIGPFIGLWASF